MQFTKIIKKELPVSLEIARQHLRVGDAAHDDALIAAKLEMAIGIAEDFTNRIIREQFVEFHVLLGEDSEEVRLPGHTSNVTGVSCLGNPIPDDKYEISLCEYEYKMTVDPEYAGKKLTVQAIVGYSKETLPPAIQAAALMILATLYDNESDNVVGRSVSRLSLTAEKLLRPWRLNPYGDV